MESKIRLRFQVVGFLLVCLMAGRVKVDAQTISCYSCGYYSNIADNQNCQFPGSSTPTCTGTQCGKSTGSVSGVTTIFRGCSVGLSNSCYGGSYGGVSGTVCGCTSNLCNGASTSVTPVNSMNSLILALLLAVAARFGF